MSSTTFLHATRIAFAKDQVAKLEVRVTTLQESINTETADHERLKSSKQKLLEANRALADELEQSNAQFSAKKKEEDAKNAECNALKRSLAELGRTLDSLKRDINGKVDRVRDARSCRCYLR